MNRRSLLGAAAVFVTGAIVIPTPAAKADNAESLGSGVEHFELSAAGYQIHAIHLAPAAPVLLKVVPAAPVAGRVKTTDLCRQVKCLAGINGSFFNIGNLYPGQPEGMPIGDVVVAGLPRVNGIDPPTQQLSISSAGQFTAGQTCDVAAPFCLGASYHIMIGGNLQQLPANDGRTWGPNPQTMVCWNATGDRWFFVSEGRENAQHLGLTMADLAGICKSKGGSDAIGMDNGGSSTETVAGRLINQPSDTLHGHPGVHIERPVTNTIMVMRGPGFVDPPSPPPPPPPKPQPKPRPVVTTRPAPAPTTAVPATVPVTLPTTTVPPPPPPQIARPIAAVEPRSDSAKANSAAIAVLLLIGASAGLKQTWYRTRLR